MTPPLCDQALQQLIRGNLTRFQRTRHDHSGLRHSAVALVVTDAREPAGVPGIPHFEHQRDRATLILTRRSSGLRRHGGQWALPGGRIDQGESASQAALRELREEVGLTLGEDAVLGKLDDFTTRSGFVITPMVVWGGRGCSLEANPAEVASIHLIPLDQFLRRDAPRFIAARPGEEPVLNMPVGHRGIFAPTAAMLLQFREVALLGRETRVAHYEQPGFAWR